MPQNQALSPDDRAAAPVRQTRVGYVVNTYPRPSHSFIRREIAALERLGLSVRRFAMRRDPQASAAEDLSEARLTEYLLGERAGFASAAARGLWRRGLGPALAVARARAAAGESPLTLQLAYVAEAAVIAARARALGLDHLHAHFGTNPARVVAYARLLGGPPYSLTVHGPEEFDAPERLDLGGKVAGAAFAVAVSQYGRSQLFRWTDPAHWDRVRVIHCGLDPQEFAAPSMPAGRGHFVAVGRFAEQKGFGLLVRAFRLAQAQSSAIRLTLVGDGPLRPAIEREIAAAGLGGSVTLTGWQDPSGVRRAVEAADTLVVPSFAEGLPVVLMEAMALARPVIATFIAGIPELVRPTVDGWLVPAGDADALADAMISAANTDAATLARMGMAARDRVWQRHDIGRSAERLAALFAQSQDRRAPGQPRPRS